jgi:Peptidase family S51
MVMTPSIGEDFVRWKPPAGSDRALGLVDFSMFPHLDHENMPDNSMANAEKWAAGMPQPVYLIDDQTAIKVTDGAVEVVSEGHWNCSPPRTESPSTGDGRFRMLVHPWGLNADIGCGAKTLRCAGVHECPLRPLRPERPE